MSGAERLQVLDWPRIEAEFDAFGCAAAGPLLCERDCAALRALYDDDGRFRSRIVVGRHGFGQGEDYAHPVPAPVAALHPALHERLAPLANRRNERMGIATRYPAGHAAFLARCHDAGQTRPTPLLLRYGPGGDNRPHQHLHGEHAFLLQVAILLSEPDEEFTGGDFVLAEQRPRMQSRAEVVPLRKGEGVVFAVHARLVRDTRGTCRVTLRHGVGRVRAGERYATGLIVHDAR